MMMLLQWPSFFSSPSTNQTPGTIGTDTPKCESFCASTKPASASKTNTPATDVRLTRSSAIGIPRPPYPDHFDGLAGAREVDPSSCQIGNTRRAVPDNDR